MFKKIIYLIFIIAISGFSAIFADRYLFPRIANTSFFSRSKLLRSFTADVTVINKTEQVYVKEDSTVAKLASNINSSVVNIISFSEPDLKSKNQENATKNLTGVVVTSDGLIMTYFSSIPQENLKYKVILADQSTYDADFLSVDSYSNLGFLKINASNLPTLSFANSDDFQAGEKIIAIGNDLGNYQNRFAQGLLNDFNSGFNISSSAISSSEKMEGVFETDKKLEDGFVGGPVIDYSGQAIAITGSVIKNNEAQYFLIPSSKVQAVIQKTIKQETRNNAQLGIYYIPVTKTLALTQSLPVEKGAQIFSPSGQQGLAMIANSAASKAGLQIYDIITAVNAQEINSQNTLPDLLYKYKKGDTIELTVLRAGKEIKLSVQL
ncbi:MAG TPA: S1C family serine protease [Patescibacteria group bacterium]|nr:S1C family serine protease [Patescibacteria group bacterium]